MFHRMWVFLVGSPLPTQELAHRRLSKFRALAAFSPDALSSITYANQEIFLGLALAGSAGLALSMPVGLVIVGLLLLVALSYYQTIAGYPSGGGSYVVARDNLGALPGQVAGAALMIDYVLTAAVSLTAGVEALASAFPVLWPYRTVAALLLLLVITLINLRGAEESGLVMSGPVYLFVVTYLGLIGYGLFRAVLDGPGQYPANLPVVEPLSLLLIMRAFSAGSTALTGIEFISNGVPAFRPPEAKNAGKTLLVMAVLMGILFAGSLGLIHYFAVLPGGDETILSALARRIVGSGPVYYLVQISTLLVLVVAANTSFAGFPRIVSILARDKYLPRQLSNIGDRLVYSNGMVLLLVLTGGLIVLFGGDLHALVPLFAIGAFLAFTLSQAGMVVHWRRVKGRSWRLKSLLNGLGAVGTGIALIVIGISKFMHGAWITMLLIPLIVFVFYKIQEHYQEVRRELTLRGLPPSLKPAPRLRLVIPISGVHRGTIEAVSYARTISDKINAVYIELEPGRGEEVRREWQLWFPDLSLDVLPSPYRSIISPLLEYLDQMDAMYHDGQLAALVLPEIVPARGWQTLLHNQVAWLIKATLLYRRRHLGFQRLIIEVPYHLKR